MRYVFCQRNPETGLTERAIEIEAAAGQPVTWKGNPTTIANVQRSMREEGLDPFKAGSFEPAIAIYSGSYFWLAKEG